MNKKTIRNAVFFSAIATGLLYAFEKMVFKLNTSSSVLDSGTCHTYKWKYGDVSYTKEGKGKPVLLIHDLSTGSSSYEWKKLTGSLKKTNTVYTIDLPGFGKSSKEKMMYTGYMYVHLLDNFIKEVIDEKTSIISSGDSSSIAVMTAFTERDLTGKVILISPQDPESMIMYPDLKNRLKYNLMCLPLFGTLIYILHNTKLSYIRKYRNEYYNNNSIMTVDEIKAELESSYLGGPDARFAGASVEGRLVNMNVVHGLKGITKKVYLMYGSNDDTAVKNAEFYKNMIPSAEVYTITDTKKRPHMEHPDDVFAFINDIIR